MSTTATAETDDSRIEQLEATVDDLQRIVKRQADRIDDLKAEIDAHKQHTGRKIAGIRSRVSEAEGRIESIGSHDPADDDSPEAGSDGTTPGVDGEKTGSQATTAPIFQLVSIPEHIAERELSANQKRARFIARDVTQYAEKAPAGHVIDSRTVKKVITAAEGTKPHTQTVARVMDFLADMGKDSVEQTKRRGRKVLAFDRDLAEPLADTNAGTNPDGGNHSCCDGDLEGTHANSVI